MKASKNQGLSSSNRYKMAAIKRFTNFMFWGPPLILGSVLLIVWQYQQHPEWLSGVQGEGTTLPQSDQFEEPGIYDDLPIDTSSPSLNNSANNENLPFIDPPPSSLNTTNPDSLLSPQSDESGSVTQGNSPGAKLPNLFPPLFPVKNNRNRSRPNSPSIRPSTPIKINVSSESELEKALRQQPPQSQSPPVQNNSPTTGRPSGSEAPSTSTNQTAPNSSIPPQNGQNYQNYQTPYAPQPVVPQYNYSPLPSSTYNNQIQPNYGQTNIPSYGNNGVNSGNTSQNSTINGRPAPQFQPSIQGSGGEFDRNNR